jgi:hypothetical protein
MVSGLVLNVFENDLAAVELGGVSAGDGGRRSVAVLYDFGDAAGCVVGDHGFEFGV